MASAEPELISALNPVFTWKVGDKWQVRTWLASVKLAKKRGEKDITTRKAKALEAQFEVMGVKTNKSIECYEVRIMYPKAPDGFQERCQLYYSTQRGNLVQVVNNSLRADGTELKLIYDYNRTNTPTCTPDVMSMIPFDFPIFAESGKRLSVKDGDRETKQEITQSKDGDFETLITTIAPGQVRQYERKVVQKWRKGKPWWIETKVFVNGEITKEAELVMDDGGKSGNK